MDRDHREARRDDGSLYTLAPEGQGRVRASLQRDDRPGQESVGALLTRSVAAGRRRETERTLVVCECGQRISNAKTEFVQKGYLMGTPY